MLERYFKQKFAESFLYKDIGSWWELKGNAYEIDIVALCLEKDKAVAVEVEGNVFVYISSFYPFV